MQPTIKYHRSKKIVWKITGSFLLSTILLYFLLQWTSFEAILQLLQHVKWTWLIIGLVFYGVTIVLRAYRFAGLLDQKKPLYIIPEIISLSFINNIFPARLGEAIFPLLLKKRHNVPFGQSLGSLLIVRVLDLVSVMSLFVASVWWHQRRLYLVSPHLYWTGTTVGGLFTAAIVMLPLIVGKVAGRIEDMEKHFDWQNVSISESIKPLLNETLSILHKVHDPKLFYTTYLWSILGWITTFAWFYAFLNAVRLPFAYSEVVIGGALATISKVIPFASFGGFGAHDIGWAIGFQYLGVPIETAVSSGIVVNLFTLASSTLFMLLCIIPYISFCVVRMNQANLVEKQGSVFAWRFGILSPSVTELEAGRD